MSGIIEIFEVLSPKEKKEFATYLKYRNRRKGTKNVALIKLIEAGKTKHLHKELYGTAAKSSYHMLHKRVQDSLIDFMAGKAFEKESSEEMELLKLLLASRILFEQGVVKVAIKILQKAENKAKYIDNYSLLNEIYQTKIQYAYLNPQWHLKTIIDEFEQNQALHQRAMHLNMAYATIKNEIGTLKTGAIHDLIDRVFNDFSLQINKDLTYKSLYQLMVITAKAAKLQNDYYTISPYIIDIFTTMRQKGEVPEKYRYYHLNMLYLMAVTDFRNKRFQASKQRLAEFNAVSQRHGKNYTKVFYERITVLTALNELYTGNIGDAEAILREATSISLNGDLVFLMCLFLQERFSEAYGVFKGLKRSDDWYEKKMGWTWVLKKNIIELLLLVELDRLDLFLNRYERFKRKFNRRLTDVGEQRVLVFLTMIQQFYEHPEQVATKTFEDTVQESFEWIGREQEDIFVMSFFAWLRSKMQRRDLYKVTLEIVTF